MTLHPPAAAVCVVACCAAYAVGGDGSLAHIERSGNMEWREETGEGDVTIAGGYNDGRLLLCAPHATITLLSPHYRRVSGEKSVQHGGLIARSLCATCTVRGIHGM